MQRNVYFNARKLSGGPHTQPAPKSPKHLVWKTSINVNFLNLTSTWAKPNMMMFDVLFLGNVDLTRQSKTSAQGEFFQIVSHRRRRDPCVSEKADSISWVHVPWKPIVTSHFLNLLFLSIANIGDQSQVDLVGQNRRGVSLDPSDRH